MLANSICEKLGLAAFCFSLLCSLPLQTATAEAKHRVNLGNFGLPGIIDLPIAKHLPDGELVVTQQLHKSLARSGISFQAFPA